MTHQFILPEWQADVVADYELDEGAICEPCAYWLGNIPVDRAGQKALDTAIRQACNEYVGVADWQVMTEDEEEILPPHGTNRAGYIECTATIKVASAGNRAVIYDCSIGFEVQPFADFPSTLEDAVLEGQKSEGFDPYGVIDGGIVPAHGISTARVWAVFTTTDGRWQVEIITSEKQ